MHKFRIVKLIPLFIFILCCKKQVTPPPPVPLNEAFGLAIPYSGHSRTIDISTRYEMGIRWVRRDVSWSSAEKSRGQFDFTEIDAAVNAEINGGVNVLAILNYGNTLYNQNPSATDAFPPDTLEYFGNFVTNAVNHFKGRIKVWEIWNEPNGPTFWKPRPNPDEFGKLVLIAAKAIRNADPLAKIMLGGMVGNSDPIIFGQRAWGFTEDLLKAYPELINWIDIYAIHPYTFLQFPIPEAKAVNAFQSGYIDMITNFRSILDNAGATNKPVWATELGWHSATQSVLFKGVPEDMQAALLVRACVLAFSLGIEKVFPYTYSDGPEDLSVSESHFGIMRYLQNTSGSEPHDPKPAYFAFKNMVNQLSDKHFSKDLKYVFSLDDKIYVYQFDNVIVAWTISNSPQEITMEKLPQSVFDINGNNIVVESKTIKISKYPTYIYL